MRIVFFGTPDYVLPVLDSLYKKFKQRPDKTSVVAVVTQKPKPVGRKKIITYSPVDRWAHQKKIPIYYDPVDLITNSVSVDLGVLASYGNIIPKKVLNYFSQGIINVHPSLLPKYRGASPIQAAIASNETQTGVTIIKLDEKLDHGPIISQFKESIKANDTTESLRERLFKKSADVVTTLIPAYVSGKITSRKQNHKKASFTSTVIKNHAFIPPQYIDKTTKGQAIKGKWQIGFIDKFTQSANPTSLECLTRAMYPWPIAWTFIKTEPKGKSKRLIILKVHIEEKKLLLDEVQMEGKNPVSWIQFMQGYPKVMFE